MPWNQKTLAMQRYEFVELAGKSDANVRQLCRRFGISPTTGYKWLERFAAEGAKGLTDQSRAPKHSPARTPAGLERRVVALHRRNPCWGPRKLRVLLPENDRPAASTVAAILRRHGLKVHTDAQAQPPYQRFCHEHPNDLWQMDFKGDFAMRRSRCYPLTLLDDHSRYALALQACPAMNRSHVQPALERVFDRYGLPHRILCDNAPPWGNTDPSVPLTALGVWLLRLGVDVIHGRPYHPQTQGKCERFHRSFKVEVLNRSAAYRDLAEAQKDFDRWRQSYNHERPHQALDLATPATRYHLSPRSLPSFLPPIEYLPDDIIRTVKPKGEITFKNHFFAIGHPFVGLPIALRPQAHDGLFAVFFSWKKLGLIDLSLNLKPKFRYNSLLPL